MWVRKSSIRPVPAFARVTAATVDKVRETLLSQSEEDVEEGLDEFFEDFEQSQPALYATISGTLEEPMEETTRALGYFLALVVWLSFQDAHGRALKSVSTDEIRGTTELLEFDSQLRAEDPTEPLETDDVITMQQPGLMQFVHEQIQGALEDQGSAANLDELQSVYKILMVELLSLSYAVSAPIGFPLSKAEAQA
jgi:hypothetical protein